MCLISTKNLKPLTKLYKRNLYEKINNRDIDHCDHSNADADGMFQRH